MKQDLLDFKNRLQFKTFGCKVNTYDTGLLEKSFQSFSVQQPVFILNTCAVTKEATKEALRTVKKIKKQNAESIVVVTGCAAQVDTEDFTQLNEVDLIVANSHKADIKNILTQFIEQRQRQQPSEGQNNRPLLFKSNIFKVEDFGEGGGLESQHTRSYLKIQDGCNSFCTFCVIPFARGKSRSLSILSLREKLLELEQQGIQEVLLTGVHIGDYEFGLENLLEDLLKNTSMPRLRLASLEPIEVSDRLLELYQDDRLCSHFHMSIQSATTSVLAQMKRKYSPEHIEKALLNIYKKVPYAYVGMDIIAGFVGESDKDFEETYENLKDWPWTRLHVFPYSERPGTWALRLPNKNKPEVIQSRAAQLRQLSWHRLTYQAEQQKGRIKKGLVLKNSGKNANYQAIARDQWSLVFESEEVFDSITSKEVSCEVLEVIQNPQKQDIQLLVRSL